MLGHRSYSAMTVLLFAFALAMSPSFNLTDRFGRRSGYAYDYQQKIAAYTGWKYEYVTGT